MNAIDMGQRAQTEITRHEDALRAAELDAAKAYDAFKADPSSQAAATAKLAADAKAKLAAEQLQQVREANADTLRAATVARERDEAAQLEARVMAVDEVIGDHVDAVVRAEAQLREAVDALEQLTAKRDALLREYDRVAKRHGLPSVGRSLSLLDLRARAHAALRAKYGRQWDHTFRAPLTQWINHGFGG